MQKLITVSVDTKQLAQNPNNPFTINEVDSIKELLEQGWEIEEWDFLKEGEADGEILLLVILNDDAMFDKEDGFDDEFDFDDDETDDDDLDNDEKWRDGEDEAGKIIPMKPWNTWRQGKLYCARDKLVNFFIRFLYLLHHHIRTASEKIALRNFM